MAKTTLVVLCAGESTRFQSTTKKQWLRIDNDPLWLYVTKRLSSYAKFANIIIVSHKDELSYMNNFTDNYSFVTGGSTRQESMNNALQKVTTKYVMITDVARSCVPKKVIKSLIKSKKEASCIVPILNVTDTVIYENNTIDRVKVKLIQTPQLSDTKVLKKALKYAFENKIAFTDDSSAIRQIGGTVCYIVGSSKSNKLTFGNELKQLNCLKKPSKDTFVGFGIDIHQFEQNKKMYLGGVKLDTTYGFKAHSDGDVLIHSVIDALLGACGAGDIGEFFPDTNDKYKDIDSKELLKYIVKFINNIGFSIVNIDLTILAQIPKINPYKNKIRSAMAKLLQIDKQNINIKATTSEKMGFVGKKEGITVYSTANLKYYDWTK